MSGLMHDVDAAAVLSFAARAELRDRHFWRTVFIETKVEDSALGDCLSDSARCCGVYRCAAADGAPVACDPKKFQM